METEHRADAGAYVLHVRCRPGTPEPAFRALLDVLQGVTAVVEPLPPAAALADVRGALLYHGRTPVQLAEGIHRAAAERGIDCRVGVAATRTLAATASGLPGDEAVRAVPVALAEAAAWLAPLPVEALYGVGRAHARTLAGYGVRTVGTLAAVPLSTLQRIFGARTGLLLHQRSRGIDVHRVTATALPETAAASRSFDGDTLDPSVIRAAILAAVVEIGARLRARHQATGALTLTVRFADGSTTARTRTLPGATHHTEELRNATYRAFDALGLQRARVRGVTVTAERLVDAEQAVEQLTFDREMESSRRLEPVIDEANARFGADTVRPATLAHRPHSA